MAKSEFKIKNTNSLTTEQVKGKPVEFKCGNDSIPLGIITYADKDYLYIEFEQSDNKCLVAEFNPKCSMEIKQEYLLTVEVDK